MVGPSATLDQSAGGQLGNFLCRKRTGSNVSTIASEPPIKPSSAIEHPLLNKRSVGLPRANISDAKLS
eukprot:COSAG02_NODE_3131_length_7311_cov_11.071131_4_plen_68_part_00